MTGDPEFLSAFRDAWQKAQALRGPGISELDALGATFSDYRAQIYEAGFGDVTSVSLAHIGALCDVAIPHLDATIAVSRRRDGLYESYNLVRISSDGRCSLQ